MQPFYAPFDAVELGFRKRDRVHESRLVFWRGAAVLGLAVLAVAILPESSRSAPAPVAADLASGDTVATSGDATGMGFLLAPLDADEVRALFETDRPIVPMRIVDLHGDVRPLCVDSMMSERE